MSDLLWLDLNNIDKSLRDQGVTFAVGSRSGRLRSEHHVFSRFSIRRGGRFHLRVLVGRPCDSRRINRFGHFIFVQHLLTFILSSTLFSSLSQLDFSFQLSHVEQPKFLSQEKRPVNNNLAHICMSSSSITSSSGSSTPSASIYNTPDTVPILLSGLLTHSCLPLPRRPFISLTWNLAKGI